MMLVVLRRSKVQQLAIFSIVVLALNFLSLRYLVSDVIENANLAALAGHRVAIDPGHGGIDSGASANGVVEKEITLAISLKLAQILQDNGATVLFTRDTDVDYYTRGKGGKRNDLLKRINVIEQSNADIFISIHCNAIRGATLAGAQVFYNPKLPENKILADGMQQALKNFPPGNKRQSKQDLHILLLNAINRPGVLVETGYVTNQQEAAKLADEQYQQKLAEYLAKALAYHFSQNAGR